MNRLLRPALLLALAMILPFALPAAGGDEPLGTLRFLESVPEETVLDQPAMDQAWQVWPVVLSGAARSISVASFYFSRQGDGQDASAPAGVADHLAPLISLLPEVGARGVDVRVLGDRKFLKTYPEALGWLDARDGVASRTIDAGAHWGGVMHAKYFVVDGRALYVGSQNWDWRALSQIHELGALVEHPRLAAQLQAVFDLDWELAGHEAAPAAADEPENQGPFARWADQLPARLACDDGSQVEAVLAASPPRALPAGVPWDLPLLVEMIDSARDSVRVQLLSYGVTDREDRLFDELDSALRRAAVRKVKVQIILANWSKSRYAVPWIKSLAAVPGVEIRFTNIPEHSLGFIPFARVEHAKYLTVDGQAAWVGTSNWSRDYFFESRNISLLLHGAGAARQLDAFFAGSWNGPYAETVSPCGDYQPPRRN